MTHSELCILACRWLAKLQRCIHAFADVTTMNVQEFPDAIGYRNSLYKITIVVEVKTSVADFKRDAHKSWRRSAVNGYGGGGMGRHRYYLVPEGLVGVGDIPDDHGLLYAKPDGKIKVVREAPPRDQRDADSELSILSTMLRRHAAGIPWIADEFRFETMAETKRRTSPAQRAA